MKNIMLKEMAVSILEKLFILFFFKVKILGMYKDKKRVGETTAKSKNKPIIKQ